MKKILTALMVIFLTAGVANATPVFLTLPKDKKGEVFHLNMDYITYAEELDIEGVAHCRVVFHYKTNADNKTMNYVGTCKQFFEKAGVKTTFVPDVRQ